MNACFGDEKAGTGVFSAVLRFGGGGSKGQL